MWYTHLHTAYKILFTQPDHIPTQRQHMNTKHTQTISSAQPGLPTMDSSVGTGEGYSQGCLMNLLLREVRIRECFMAKPAL